MEHCPDIDALLVWDEHPDWQDDISLSIKEHVSECKICQEILAFMHEPPPTEEEMEEIMAQFPPMRRIRPEDLPPTLSLPVASIIFLLEPKEDGTWEASAPICDCAADAATAEDAVEGLLDAIGEYVMLLRRHGPAVAGRAAEVKTQLEKAIEKEGLHTLCGWFLRLRQQARELLPARLEDFNAYQAYLQAKRQETDSPSPA